MAAMRLATWNVNSIRTRVDRVVDWLQRADVDVLAMQETKCTDAQFPTMPFSALGYEVAHVGLNQWNGVAIASRVGLDNIEVGFDGQPTWSAKPDVEATAEARALGATCGGVRVWSLYVPNGRTLEDPHYRYKLDWLAALQKTAASWVAADPSMPIALVGDWNIAPHDEDVWDMAAFEGRTHVSEAERAAFFAMADTQFTDVVRPFTPGPGVYTYWDYTQLAFQKRRGMRIDFILGSPALAERVTHAEIVKDERRPGKKGSIAPSDHAPVLVEI
jgi:exodeoxyribonuclease-3